MIVVTARRSAQHHPRSAAISGSVDRNVWHIHRVRIGRIDGDLLKIPAASPQRRVIGDAGPARAGIVGAKESALTWRRARRARARRRWRRNRSAEGWLDLRRSLGNQAVDYRIDAIWIRCRDRDARAADACLRQAVGELSPGAA